MVRDEGRGERFGAYICATDADSHRPAVRALDQSGHSFALEFSVCAHSKRDTRTHLLSRPNHIILHPNHPTSNGYDLEVGQVDIERVYYGRTAYIHGLYAESLRFSRSWHSRDVRGGEHDG